MDATPISDALRRMDWLAIVSWAGATIAERGRRYARAGQVLGLAVMDDGAPLAWVQGTRRYATLLGVDQYGLSSACTCPYDGVCKHAVALLLAYQAAAGQQSLPIASAADPRLALLASEDDSADASEDWPVDSAVDAGPLAGATAASLRAYLDDLPRESLVRLLEELAEGVPAVADALIARRRLATTGAGPLVAEARGVIHGAGQRRGWRDDWDDDGADFNLLRDRLTLLLAQGYADEVVELADELIAMGNELVEQSDDEGELMAEAADCLTVAFRALDRSTLPPAERMLRAIDWALADEFDLTSGATEFWAQPRAAADWSRVADVLLTRLAAMPAGISSGDRVTGWSGVYQRERLADRTSEALEQAGRRSEVIALWEREAVANASYPRLVGLLIAAGRRTEAEDRIQRGLAALDDRLLGPISELQRQQLRLWEEAGDWPRAAAFHADLFLAAPSISLLRAVRAAAERAGHWLAVRAALRHYLATGESPAAEERTVAENIIPAWPLPASTIAPSSRRQPLTFPAVGVLIELAIDEGRPDEVLHWYDQRAAAAALALNHHLVASAVAPDYPERAVAIWWRLAAVEIAQTNVRSYESAVVYLREIGRVRARQSRLDDWRHEVAALRQEQRRKRRLVELLDGLLAAIGPTDLSNEPP